VIAGVCGILVVLISLLVLRNSRAAHVEIKSMLREHKVECSGQIEQLRLELQLLRPAPGTGRREKQLLDRISRSVSLQ
jgi:hypothetical protein